MAIKNEAARKLNTDLYSALIKGEAEKVVDMCRRIPEGPLHTLTIHQDTVLHVATHSKQKSLVIDLLNLVPEDHYDRLTCQNDSGNTILVEAAASDKMVSAAIVMLHKAPMLLSLPNRRGETPIFRAARYGKNDMYKLLDAEMSKSIQNGADLRSHHFRDDKASILHISVLAEHFDLALQIARKYDYLIDKQDGDGMTALQLLACNPSAFHSGGTSSSLKKLIYSCVSIAGSSATEEQGCRVPLWENIRNQKLRYESAIELAMFLIDKDTTWEATESELDKSKLKPHRYGSSSSTGSTDTQDQEKEKEPDVKVADIPLFLATKSGCTEIVKGILETYPQAVERVDEDGRNILHLAIKYRHIQVFDMVERMETPMRRLMQKIDDDGNSILHMVGKRGKQVGHEDMRSPALVLQEDLLLFERVKKISATNFVKHYNSEGQTAEELFDINNSQLRNDAKEWMKRTAENCSIVAVLIATVAFAAAFTVPGGPNQNTGYPILENQPFFVIFTLTDVLSLAFALTSVIIFLSILTSPYRFKDFRHSLPQKLMLGITLLILSVSMMMLAFAATVVLLIRNKAKWTIALYSVAFFPVIIFAFSYLPLYVSLMRTFTYSLKQIGSVFPRCSCSSPEKSVTATFRKRFSTPQTISSLV